MYDKVLLVGEYFFQFYLLVMLNGVKVMILFEELLELGIIEVEYDVWLICIIEGDQFFSGFVGVNLNFKILVLVDCSGDIEINIFEFGFMLVYLVEKFGKFFLVLGLE